MFAINHLVVNKLKTCDTTDKAKRMYIIIAEGNLACAGTFNFNLFSVLEGCKRQGIKSDKKRVVESVNKVMEFFFFGKSIRGKCSPKKVEI